MIFKLLFFFSSVLFASPIKVVTSTTDLAWAAREIGKENVEVVSLLNGTENPHFVDTVPDFILKVADAKVVCIIGLELEIGWMPKVLSKSGNAGVQPGGVGYCETGNGAQILEKPQGQIDRSMGDVHPFGNPHFWLSPIALTEGAKEILSALIRVDPAHKGSYEKNYSAWKKESLRRTSELKAKLQKAIGKNDAPKVIEYHREFSYFWDVYGLKSLGSIEEKPGLNPSAGRIAEISKIAKSAGVKVAFAGEYAPKKTLDRFTELSGVKVASFPTSIQPEGKIKDYWQLQELWVNEIIQRIQK